MSTEFHDGYIFFQEQAGAAFAAFDGGQVGADRLAYVKAVEWEINELEKSINSFEGYQTDVNTLKGDVAEFWHSGTYNVDATKNLSENRSYVERSHDFGSADIKRSDGESYGLKYYKTGAESAKQQSKSIFEKFCEYKSKGGKETLEEYLAKRNYTDESVINDPLYSGQKRLIPTDQMKEAEEWLKKKIATEELRRPKEAARYKETLELLRDRIKDNKGNESIPLTEDDAKKLAELAKEGKFDAEDFGITAPELMTFDMLIKEALSAGVTAALISVVIKIAPEIIKAFVHLKKEGQISEEQLKKTGAAAITGSAEGFISGTVAAAISIAAKSGMLGDTMLNASPSLLGAAVAMCMNTIKGSIMVAAGKKTRTELANDLVRDVFISGASLVLGETVRALLSQLPTIGYMLGSFVGSIIGSFVYDYAYKGAISFCVDTGLTLFGLVEQDYTLPRDIIEKLGIKTFDYESFEPAIFEPKTFAVATFTPSSFEPDRLEITYLKRGVIGYNKIGYVC